jgi:hypothetical protein
LLFPCNYCAQRFRSNPKTRTQQLHNALWQQWPPYILARIHSTLLRIKFYITDITLQITSKEVCPEMGRPVTADSGRFCRLICTELSCVFSSTLTINLHDNKSYILYEEYLWHGTINTSLT